MLAKSVRAKTVSIFTCFLRKVFRKMVVIQIKKENDSFLYETSCEKSNDYVVRDLVNVWNLRLRLQQLVGGLRELALYGPMKPPDKAGLDEIEEKYNGAVLSKNEYYQADPTGHRTGNGVGPQLSETIEKVCKDTESVLSSVCDFYCEFFYLH